MYSLFDEKIFENDKVINVLLSGAFLKCLSIDARKKLRMLRGSSSYNFEL